MIVDSHTHYSEPATAGRPYDQDLIAINPAIALTTIVSLEEMIARMAQLGIDRIVQVTQSKMGYDNRYSLEGAMRYPDKILGVVGRFDPLGPDLENRLRAFYANPLILGVRFTLLTPRNSAWLRDRQLYPFLAVAQELDVPVQIYAPDQMMEMQTAARHFPGVRFLFDHMGIENKPPRAHEHVFRNWAEVISLAKEPNIWMKVSYFPEATQGSESYPFPLARQRFKELYEEVGAARLIWGSNFPPVEHVGACTHAQSLDFVRAHCDFLPATDRDAILGNNFLAQFTRTKG